MQEDASWRTKPADRFILKWIKVHLSARITPRLVGIKGLKPWMITLFSACVGTAAGLVFALGLPFIAGCLAAVAQVMDGVDGQFARLTKTQSRGGAFWDSVLDRYADGTMMMGMIVYLFNLSDPPSPWVLVSVGIFAVTGANLISYSSARGEALGLSMGVPTLAGKGTRASAMILSAWVTVFWPAAPLWALCYLCVHTNLAVVRRLLITKGQGVEENE